MSLHKAAVTIGHYDWLNLCQYRPRWLKQDITVVSDSAMNTNVVSIELVYGRSRLVVRTGCAYAAKRSYEICCVLMRQLRASNDAKSYLADIPGDSKCCSAAK